MTEKRKKDFIEKQIKQLDKEIDEGFADFEEPSDISLTATDAYTYNETGFRKGYKKGVKKAAKQQQNNKPGVLSTSKGRKNIEGKKPKGINSKG